MSPTISDRLHFRDAVFDESRVGQQVPAVALGELLQGMPAKVDARSVLGEGRAIVLGVAGAYTPNCTQRNVPEFVRSAEALRAAGYQTLVCIAPDSPWIVDRWAADVDPRRTVRFLSDGNLDFVRALKLLARARDRFLGECSQRYLMSVSGGVIDRIKIDSEGLDVDVEMIE